MAIWLGRRLRSRAASRPADTLNFINQGGISGSYGNGTLSLSGTASVAAYQTALQSITYSFSGSDPAVGGTDNSRTISWSVNDGVASSTPVTSTGERA